MATLVLATAALLATPDPAQAQACPAPTLTGRQQIWTGTVTVGTRIAGGRTSYYGFEATTDPPIGMLSDTMFDIGLNSHTIERIQADVQYTTGGLVFGLSSSLTTIEVASLRLHVCGVDYDFADATTFGTQPTYYWDSAGLDWSSVTSRTLYLSVPAAAPNAPALGAPTITGKAQVGETLTAVTTGIVDADGLTSPTYTYQWIRVTSGTDADIAGATSSTYTLVAADLGKMIKVRVTFEDDEGNTETLTSAATATVAGGELAVKTVRQIEALLAAKAQRTPAQRKVSSQLLPARQVQAYGVARLQAPVEVAADEMTMVDIRADVTPEVLARIRDLGGTVINSVPRYRAIRARLPLSAIEPLATLDAIQSIRPADEARTRAQAAPLSSAPRTRTAVFPVTRKDDTSEGDVAHRANSARTTHSVDGTGIGIGVLSDGVDTLAARQATGDLPDRVTVLPGQVGEGDEGTAMLEIVHDLAPGAELYFAQAFGGQAQFAANIEALCEAGADVIVDDIYYFREAAFQDDLIAQGVNAAVADGCVFITAGGNGGNLNDGTAGVWEGDYAAGSTLSVNGVPFGVAHDFGGDVEKNQITEDSPYGYVLQWADPLGGSANDYDLFLIDSDDYVLDSSTGTQDGTQDPIEFISSSEDDHTDARLLIVKTSGAADRYLRLDTLEGQLAEATAGKLFGHAAAENAVSVAAVDARVAAGSGGVFNGTEPVRRSNSDGPRRIFFEADGTPITAGIFSSTGGKLLQKPDLAAATCVSTSTPGFSTFCGTSSAAPHAAAIAALMLEAAGGPDNLTPAPLRTAMTGASLDIEATGVDRDSGAGIVMAPGAVDAVDVAKADRNKAPTVDGTLADRTLTPGGAAVTINVAGAFDDPDDDPLTYTVLSSDPDPVKVTVSGSMLTLTPNVPGVVALTVRATDGGGLSVVASFSVTVSVGTRDYDLDDDNLIDVGNLAQLDAIRYDLNGDGMVDVSSDGQSYYSASAFVDGALDMGCPSGCTGYELTRNLDFDTNGSGGPDAGDTYWNGGEGWVPIGGDGSLDIGTFVFLSNPFTVTFDGNGHTVSNLFIDTDNVVLVGLFGLTSSSIRNVGAIDVDVTGVDFAGGLIGFNFGEIQASYVTGRVSGRKNVGGLVGVNHSNGKILASYATSRVAGDSDVGGLVGDNRGKITAGYATGHVSGEKDAGGLVGDSQSTGEIHGSYATSRVTGDSDVGGLVGSNEGTVTVSYWDTNTSGHPTGSSGEGKTTVELQTPTGYSGIYQSWNADLWHFGTATQYPALKANGDGQGQATWQELGYQLREGPTLTATASPTQVALSWTPVTASHWTPGPSVTYTITRDDGTTLETLAENLSGLTITDTNVTAGTTYTYQIAAVVQGGEASRSPQVSVVVPTPVMMPSVTLLLTPDSIGENGGVSTVTASLDRTSNAVTTVTVSATAVGPAVSGDFMLSTNRTLTIAADQTDSTGTVTVRAVNNTVDAPNKTVRVSATADNTQGVTPPAALTLAITDDDAVPVLTLAVGPSAIMEAGGSSTVTVRITNGVTFAEDQEIALAFAGTATKGTDYTVALESLTLTAGQNSVATTVTAVQDRVDDDAETILITASHGGGTIGAEQTITIIDDDATPVVTTCSGGMAGTYPCSNVDLMSFLALADIGGGEANDIWGWTDSSTGKEYAIMGRTNGTSFVDISDPVNPIYLGNLPPHSSDSEWRDVKVYADHAFIVTEANNSGMQVFDLTQLRMVASPPATFSETAHYSGFSDAHNLAINEDSGFAYAVGTNDCGGGLHMIDIQTPTSPTSAGCFSGDGYTHDAQCVNYDGPDLDHQGKEICFNSNVDTLTIVDVTNKAGPVMLSRTGYSGSRYAHQGWLTEDQVYFLLGDESDETDNPDVTNTRTYMWNVSDLDDPALIGSHDSTTTAIDHNQYVKGNYTYQSNYHAGLRILDITDIANGNLTEAAFFDVNPGSDPTNFEGGTWSNYPFFDSGIVIVSVIEQGLFILRPNLVDSVNPALASAAVNGAVLTLTYGEVLDGSSTPATDAFTVTVAGSGRMVTHVSVSGRVVTLTLASAVAHGEAVTVSYSPGTNPIRDAAGNGAIGLSNDPVRNDAPDTTPPTVSSLTITSNPGSDRTYAEGDEIRVTATFSETVEVRGTPRLTLRVGSWTRTASYLRGTDTAALVFGYEVAEGESDTDGVGVEADSLTGGRIRDEARNNAVLDHDGLAADSGHKVDAVRPELAASGGVVVNGTTLTLTFDETLDGSSTPAAGDFTVAGGSQSRTVTGVRVSGSTVELTLNAGAEHLETGILVSYTLGMKPIRDVPGNEVEGLSREPVRNDTPDTSPPKVESVAISSNPGSDRTYAEGDEIRVTATFSETVKVRGTPRLTLRVGSWTRTADYLRGTDTAALVFGYEVAEGESDTDGVGVEADSLTGGRIRDEARNNAELDHDGLAADSGHKVDAVRPRLAASGGVVVNGTTLTLTFDEPLDGSSTPAAGDFTVAGGDTSRTVTDVALSGSAVLLTLNAGAEHLETGIQVSYTPGMKPIRDVPGNEVEGLSREPVRNDTPDTTAPTVSSVAITSNPGSDRTYAEGDEIRVTATFSETVKVRGTPRLTLRVGSWTRTADYLRGTDTAALVFGYEVAEGESDTDGVGVEADSLTGGTIRDEARNNAVLDHDGLAADSGHKVDAVRPELAASGGAVVNGTTLRLTYDEPLGGSSTPEAGDFTVTGGDRARTVTRVTVSGSTVVLTLDTAAEHLEAGIQVSYTPGTNKIRDVAGNEAEGLSQVRVTNETPDTTPPEVESLAVSSNPGSDQTYAAGDEIEVTVTFNETVEVEGTPRLTIELGSGRRTANYQGGSGTAALVFGYEVAEGESDTDGVGVEEDSLSGGTIRDEARNSAKLDHEGLAADSGHKVDGVKPDLVASGGAVVNGTTLTLTYDEPLDRSSTPDTGDFTVTGGDQARTVTRVSVSGSAVMLTLSAGAEHEEAGIRVSYTPGMKPIRDVPGNQAEGLSQVRVTNETPDTTPPRVESLGITSNPGSDQTYAAEDEIEVTVRFSETVEVEGTPQLRLRVGNRTRTAGYDSGTGTAALVFGYEVAEGDEDTGGVSIEAGRIALNRGTIEDEAENAAELAHEALATQAGHKVDGVRPGFVSAAVDGSSLTLTYGEALDGGSRPSSGDFRVEVDGSGRSVSGVSVSGSVVTLTLDPAVEHGDTGIRVSYTAPAGVGLNPLRDAVGNEARGLSNQLVTNTTGAPNTAPEITSPSSFDVPENLAVARRLVARDTDAGDEVTGWSIVGGADQSEFSIASDTGELSFRDPPDFEAPGDNQYLVTVEVRSGAGARELEAEQTFTIRVTDEREPPEVPEAPVISGETADSLTVSWSEPENTGPPITDYDVQYREEGTGSFSDALHEGPGRTLTLSDLEPGTAYEVQVKARNEEGASDWSDPGEGMTVTRLTVVMASGTDPPVSGPFTVRFSFSEPVTGFSASDIETGQDPACVDDQNNTVFCDPGIGGVQTADDRVFTTTVTPGTDRVAHSYTLRLTVAGGAVRSSVGSKPNEEPEEPLEVRVAPPGVEEPISSLGLRTSGGNGTVRLSWNLPSDNGGSAIIRYEYRFAPAGEAWSEWENVGAGTSGVMVGNLINGREYVFEVRAVNALGKGGAETVQATPERRIAPPPPRGGGGGGGGGGGLLFPPGAPAGLMAMPRDGTVRLEWSPPESDGGTPLLRYEYRLKEGRGEFGEWIPIPDSAPDEVNATGYTVGDLGNGTVYVFELRGVNLVGNGPESEAVEVAMGLDRAYWSNFGAEDLQGGEASLEGGPFGGGPQSLRLGFGAGLRFEESELDGEGEVTETRLGSYGYRYTSRTTGELRLDYDGGESCELRLTFRGEGAGGYSFRCGGVLGGQGSFRLSGTNRAPEVTSAGVYEVAENQTRVGQLEAVDPDEGDEIEGYGIAGGADGGLFEVEAETGELMFREAPDYETPGDVASDDPQSGAADNEYIVVVEVRSGEGERERKGSRAIRVRVSDEEEPPEITSVGPFEVVENRTRVGQLEAVDQDKQDEITEYGIAGGADGGLFEVEAETGELMFREAPDYENPGDVASEDPQSGAGDNEYIVVVEVRSGEGERERKGSRAIRVRVSDEEEPPGAPGAPVVTAEGSDSLKVSWREPENRGPEIVDYEVRYREGGEAGYTDGGHEGAGLEVRLSGLKEGTVYEVQVRAVNEEGMSEWSEPGEGRTDTEEADPEDPSDFTGEDLEGRRLTLRNTGEEGTAGSLELRFGEGNRFEQIESGGQEAATRAEGAARSGSYTYEKTGPGRGRLSLTYDDGSSCEVLLAFTEVGAGTFSYDCGLGNSAEGSFRLTTGSLFVPVILSSAGRNQSFFTSELTLTNRGDRDVKVDYTYTANRGGGSGTASEVLPAGRQRVETDALAYLRGLGVPIPETGNRIGTLRVEARLGSEVEAVVRTTTLVPEGRAGLAYLGVAEEEGFDEPVYLCGLRQNSRDRSNVAFQNMGAEEEGAITVRTTVYSGDVSDTSPRVLEEVTLEPGGFHQYSPVLGDVANGYVKVERVEGTAPFYAYGVINDQANSDGSFVFPVTASSLEGTAGQTLPVIVETSEFTSELTVTNFSEEPRRLDFQFVAEGIEADDKTVGFSMRLEAGEQQIIPELVEELRREEMAGLGTTRGFYLGPLLVTAEEGDLSGIVIGARTGSEGGGGQYSVFYNAVPEGEAFTKEAWVEGLQQNEENRSNLALVNTGEVDGSPSVFHLEIYDGETGLLAETVVTKPIPARGWHQINGILGSYAPETRQGYIRIEKVSGENPFLAYGVVNDGGAPGERSGDGAYLPARE